MLRLKIEKAVDRAQKDAMVQIHVLANDIASEWG